MSPWPRQGWLRASWGFELGLCGIQELGVLGRGTGGTAQGTGWEDGVRSQQSCGFSVLLRPAGFVRLVAGGRGMLGADPHSAWIPV